jgi:ribosome-binding protein aMBF1 (putative translation factor)
MSQPNSEAQDWKPLVMVKNKTKEEEIKSGNFTTEKKVDGGKNNSATKINNDVNLKKLENDEDYKLPTVSYNFKMELQKARTAKKLTQAQLAQQCNIPVNTIKDYESGKGIINTNHLNSINRKLGSKLKKTM